MVVIRRAAKLGGRIHPGRRGPTGSPALFTGNSPVSVQLEAMSVNSDPDRLAAFLAEEILRTIYGDDYQGCPVNPDHIATVIQKGLADRQSRADDLLELYEKVIEAVDLLSTPPDVSKVTDPEQLRSLLSERLDGIHAVTAKTIQTTALLRKAGSPEE